MKELSLYDRIMALKKARRETIEETALALGSSAASIRAYKINPDRTPRPKLVRQLEALEAAAKQPLGKPSNPQLFSDKLESLAHGASVIPLKEHPIMLRIEKIQELEQTNAENILEIKALLNRMVDVLNELLMDREKKKEA